MKRLSSQFDSWLGKAESKNNDENTSEKKIRAIICPHAGYSYCGATGAYSYNAAKSLFPPKAKNKDSESDDKESKTNNDKKTVFILGPDHYGISSSHDKSRARKDKNVKNTSKNHKIRCFISNADYWETPFGNVKVNREMIENELLPTNMFDLLTKDEDKQEHSLELIVPFLTYVLKENENGNSSSSIDNFEIIPIVVGHCDNKLHNIYGKIFSNYLNPVYRNDCFFVISSDFCHWGAHYHYQPMPPTAPAAPATIASNKGKNRIMVDSDNENENSNSNSNNGDNEKKENDSRLIYYSKNEIYKYIRDLDHVGMKYISQLNYNSFHEYLKETENTICGQNPICILLKV